MLIGNGLPVLEEQLLGRPRDGGFLGGRKKIRRFRAMFARCSELCAYVKKNGRRSGDATTPTTSFLTSFHLQTHPLIWILWQGIA